MQIVHVRINDTFVMSATEAEMVEEWALGVGPNDHTLDVANQFLHLKMIDPICSIPGYATRNNILKAWS